MRRIETCVETPGYCRWSLQGKKTARAFSEKWVVMMAGRFIPSDLFYPGSLALESVHRRQEFVSTGLLRGCRREPVQLFGG